MSRDLRLETGTSSTGTRIYVICYTCGTIRFHFPEETKLEEVFKWAINDRCKCNESESKLEEFFKQEISNYL